MNGKQKIIQRYFGIMSQVSPKLASKHAFKLFQKPRKIPYKPKERQFFEVAECFTVESEIGDIVCYEMGDTNGELIFLVHGWDSNPGSMSGIANALTIRGNHVVLFDLPGHGLSKIKYANILNCSLAMKAVISRVRTDKPISIISHSFGSLVSSLVLSEMKIEVRNLVYLTSPDNAVTIFDFYKNMIHLGDKAYTNMVGKAENLLGASLDSVDVLQKTRNIQYEKLTLIHDVNDKILPFKNSLKIEQGTRHSRLVSFENVGHYRMLWNEGVIDAIIKTMQKSNS